MKTQIKPNRASKVLKSIAASVALLVSHAALAADYLAWDKTFPQSDKVTHEKVSYYNRMGINIVADLYFPKTLNRSKKSAAIIVGTPFGAVKEQAGGLYAQTMAERGFVTLAFDPSYFGESGGTPRANISAEALVEDFSAAVDYLGTQTFIDRNRIGVIGVCASGSFALSAAAFDPRMKAIATVSMYDMGQAARQGLAPSLDKEQMAKNLQAIADQRWAEAGGAEKKLNIGTPQVLTKESTDVDREFYDYYRTPRGQHPRGTTAWNRSSGASLMNFFPFEFIDTISPRPILFIAGEKAHSRLFTENAFRRAGKQKELVIIPGAGHVDLYDRANLIPFAKLEKFFKDNLK